jgi:4-amino-4-deoxy-L-arabinose transferase-like glycosyltransferase
MSRFTRLLFGPAGIFVLAVVLRVGLMIGQQTHRIEDKYRGRPPGWETGRIAAHLAQGRGYSMSLDQFGPKPPTPTAWLAPLYPTVFAGVFCVCGVYTPTSIVVIYSVQILLSAWTAVLLYCLGREVCSRPVGLLAASMFAAWPPAVSFPVNIIWATTLFTALSVWLVLLLYRQAGGAGRAHAVLIGVVMALLLLAEPAVALFLPTAAIWLIVRRGRPALTHVLLMAAITVVLIAPWLYRDYVVLGKLVPIKSNMGHELFIGNHPEATGFYRRSSIIARRVLDEPTRARLATAGETEMTCILGERAVRWIRQDPGRFAVLTARRAWWFWRLKFDTRWHTLIDRRSVWRWLRWADEVSQDGLLILAYLGAVFGLKRRAGVGVVVLYSLTYPIPYYITHVDIPRYRFPVVPLVMLLAAYALVEGVRYLRRRRRAVVPAPASTDGSGRA